MDEPKDLKGLADEKDTNAERRGENEPRDSIEDIGASSNDSQQLDENKRVKELIEKLIPLVPLAMAAFIPSSLMMGMGGLLPGSLNALVGMVAGVGAYHTLKNLSKGIPDLGAPRLEDAVFQILQSDQSPVGFFIKDLSYKYVYVNLAMAKFLGRPASEVIGLTNVHLYPEEDVTASTRSLEQVIGGQMVHLQHNRMVEGVPTTLQEILVAKRGTGFEPVGIYGISWEVHEPSEAIDLSEIDDKEFPSLAMRLTLKDCLRVARLESHVLLTGERGSGKDYLARYIHDHSRRRDDAFEPINCSTLSENLMASELFGHVRGAFTGAVSTKKGLVELAKNGTLFLNEIGDMSLNIQPKLLSFLDDGVYRQVGGSRTEHSNAWIIAATNKDLEAEVKEGRFRMDLFDRLNVFRIEVPPLRHRKEDIPVLAKKVLSKLCDTKGIERIPDIEKRGLDRLLGYDWPGNVRELRNVLERALVISGEGPITLEALQLEKPGKLGHRPQGRQRQGSEGEPEANRADTAELARAKDRFDRLSPEEQSIHIRNLFVDVCGRKAGSVTYIAEVLGTTDETVRKALKAAHAGEGERKRPKKKAYEEMMPRIREYLNRNL